MYVDGTVSGNGDADGIDQPILDLVTDGFDDIYDFFRSGSWLSSTCDPFKMIKMNEYSFIFIKSYPPMSSTNFNHVWSFFSLIPKL